MISTAAYMGVTVDWKRARAVAQQHGTAARCVACAQPVTASAAAGKASLTDYLLGVCAVACIRVRRRNATDGLEAGEHIALLAVQYRSAFMAMLRIERTQSVSRVPRGCERTGCPDYLSLADAKDIFSAYSKFHGEMLKKKRPMRLLVCVR